MNSQSACSSVPTATRKPTLVSGVPLTSTVSKFRDEDREWQRRAACRDADPELFFSKHICADDCAPDCQGRKEAGRHARIRAAKAYCDECPVAIDCLLWSIDTGQQFGIWGGSTERERRRMAKHRLSGSMATYEDV
jgi:WhiB family redox-sensing transcriptional regulator